MQNKQTTPKSVFWTGFRDCTPFILVAAPFGLLFGVAATEMGLNLVQTMTMTVLVIAGAAQFTALILLEEQAPTLIIIATALAVNLRLAMYSAALVPYLGKSSGRMKLLIAYFNVDQVFGLAVTNFPENPEWTLVERAKYFIGAGLAVTPFWIAATLIGAVFGAEIPPAFALDFALPICFLAIVAPAIRTIPHFAAAATSIVGALAFAWIPYSLGLILAATAAMIVGAQAELWLKRRAK